MNERNPLIIFGSSRQEGKTFEAIQAVIKDRPIPVVDLSLLNISYYDYTYKNAEDDFVPLAEKMMNYNPLILATPVYWYTMSAIMKTFIDRWSDLLDLRKDLGRRLINKELYVITSYGSSLPKDFEAPFSQTCDYLKMQYRGCLYFYSGENSALRKKNSSLAQKFFDNVWSYE